MGCLSGGDSGGPGAAERGQGLTEVGAAEGEAGEGEAHAQCVDVALAVEQGVGAPDVSVQWDGAGAQLYCASPRWRR
jgi:hypothetical protein